MSITIESSKVSLSREAGPYASESLLGINLELTSGSAASLLSNRIRNPKFAGPPDGQTGLAAEWKPFGNNMGGMNARLVQGMFMSPSQSQLIQNYTQPYGAGIVQTKIPVFAGESLRLRFWAKVRHSPVHLEIAIRSMASRDEGGYAKTEVIVDCAYWKCFEMDLQIGKTDPEAALIILLKETGVVIFDQITLEPVEMQGVNPDIEEAILRLNPSAIRFPGGCMSTNYHWQFGTGPRELRPALFDPVFKTRADYDFGTDEYLALCRELNIPLHITVNIGSGTPGDAVEWARYCLNWFQQRGIEPPPAYFQMGNEQYGSWETSHMDASMYVEALKAFVPGVREAYPSSRIIALAEPFASGIAGKEHTRLRASVLEHASGLFDVLAINRYKGQWFDNPEEQLENSIDSVEKIRKDLETLNQDCRDAGWSPRIALTEWNYWLHASHWDEKEFYEPDDALHGIFFAGVVHTFLRMADTLEIASYYHLIHGMGLLRDCHKKGVENAIGHLYRFYRPALPGHVVRVEGDFPKSIDAIAVRNPTMTNMFFCNRSSSESVEFELSEAVGTVKSVQTMTAPDCYSPMKAIGNTVRERMVHLPPLSVTRIEVESEESN